MKAYFHTSLFLILFGFNNINAQESHLFKINQVSIQPFISQGLSSFMTKEAFQEFTGNNHGLSQDLLNSIGGENSYYYGWYGPSNIGLNANVGLQIRAKESDEYRKNVKLRVGLQFHSVQLYSNTARIDYRNRIDTLISSNNSVSYVDSIERNSAYFAKKAEMLNLDAALIFHTDQSQQWSLFGGIGFSFGASINAYTELDFMVKNNFEITGNYQATNSDFYSSGWNSEYSRFENKTNLTGIIYLPMGVDMRLGNHKDFWKRLHLFYEFRPSLTFHHAPEIGTVNSFTISHGLGLNVRF